MSKVGTIFFTALLKVNFWHCQKRQSHSSDLLFLPLFDNVSPHRRLIWKVSQVIVCDNHSVCLLCELEHESTQKEQKGIKSLVKNNVKRAYYLFKFVVNLSLMWLNEHLGFGHIRLYFYLWMRKEGLFQEGISPELSVTRTTGTNLSHSKFTSTWTTTVEVEKTF